MYPALRRHIDTGPNKDSITKRSLTSVMYQTEEGRKEVTSYISYMYIYL